MKIIDDTICPEAEQLATILRIYCEKEQVVYFFFINKSSLQELYQLVLIPLLEHSPLYAFNNPVILTYP